MAGRPFQSAPWGTRVKIAVLVVAVTAGSLAVVNGLYLADAAAGGTWLGLAAGNSGAFVVLSILVLALASVFALLGAAWVEGPMKAALGRLRLALEANRRTGAQRWKEAQQSLDAVESGLKTLDDSLGKTAGEVSESGAALLPALESLHDAQGSLSSSATMQARQAGDIRAESESLAAVLTTVIQNAEDALKVSKLSVENAKSGGDVVNKTVKHMNAITITVANSAKIIRELGERSKGIGEIIRVIDDIADQTNLLALNAAIEAARAGDQGRGFAVVADEVRKLAERTTIATKEIATTIRSIQAETNSAVAAMDAGIKEVDKGAGLAVQAGVWLQKIVGGARKVTDMISKISTSSQAQNETAGGISEAIARLSRSSEENFARVTEARDAAENLLAGVRALTEIARSLPAPADFRDALDAARARTRPSLEAGREEDLLRLFDIEMPRP